MSAEQTQQSFTLDGQEIPFQPGQTILQAALAAGQFIPHLCYHPEIKPLGNCRLCTVEAGGRETPACTTPCRAGLEVKSNTPEINRDRVRLVEMLFVEGNHLCPLCEKSGHCHLQAVAYYLGMTAPRFPYFYPQREVDASHPDLLLDKNRCIFCGLCVAASRDIDKKQVFELAGRGVDTHLVVNSSSGLLKDTDIEVTDRAASICPVGVILVKREGFQVPIGDRIYDQRDVDEFTIERAKAVLGEQNG